MTVKEHYDTLLGSIYSWMIGDFESKSTEFKNFLTKNGIVPSSSRIAVDLGAGHGLQSIPLAEMGFQVLAVDFSQQLLDELDIKAKGLNIKIINEDIRNVKVLGDKPELIVCCGDTVTHLDSKSELKNFLTTLARSLEKNGKLILSFRDYSNTLTGVDRVIPVKSDETKILTCILDYEDEYVHVTDLLHERIDNAWKQKISTYKKIRLATREVIEALQENGMLIEFNGIVSRLTTIIARKK